MPVKRKCEVCSQFFTKDSPAKDNSKRPYLCSGECVNLYFEKEAAIDAETSEWEAQYAKAIAKGEAESGRKFEDAGDGLIMSWIDEYAYKDDAQPV